MKLLVDNLSRGFSAITSQLSSFGNCALFRTRIWFLLYRQTGLNIPIKVGPRSAMVKLIDPPIMDAVNGPVHTSLDCLESHSKGMNYQGCGGETRPPLVSFQARLIKSASRS